MKYVCRIAVPALVLVFLIVPAQSALAVDDVFTPPPPIVHLMVDTSGSMLYDSNGSPYETGDYDLQALPVCSLLPGESGKTRATVVNEILLGSLSNYYCTYEDRSTKGQGKWTSDCPDCGDPIPLVVEHGTRNGDGLIDRAGTRFKFGLATMDTDPHQAGGAKGDWSYGPDKKPDFGAQNKHAKYGKLVVPSASDTVSDIATVNQNVKTALLSSQPWGQTPIGAFLWDMEYMYSSEATFNADTYANCRDKHIVLITDGRQNLDSSNWDTSGDWPPGNGNGNGNGNGHGGGPQQDPYPDPATEAQRLRSLGFEVWVVAFPVADGLTSDAYNIATYNGALTDDHYFMVDNIDALELALFHIFNQIGLITQSRTKTVYTNNTGNYQDVQYQFNAAYANVPDPTDDNSVPGFRQGIIERSVYKCGVDENYPGRSGLAEIQNLATLLNATADGARNIYTMVDGQMQAFISTNNAITNTMLAAPSGNGTVLDFGRDSTTGWCKSGTLTGSKDQKLAQWRTNLFNYIRATPDSCRDGYKLGAVYHSTPALQDNLEDVELSIPSFRDYKASIANRPFMLYAATHDGMMHAFRTDRPDGRNQPDYWGKELWAYIPSHQLGALRYLPEGRETALDGAPVVADLVMSRTYASTSTEDETDWKSVLLFGDRSGGRGYSALDVTDPTNGEWSVMWEISATNGRCPGGSAACNPGGSGAYANSFSRLGYTYGKPAVGTVMICPSASGNCTQGQLEEVAVAVIPGGSSTGLSGTNVGKTVFVVRLDTGAKLAEFSSGDLDGDFADVYSACDSVTNIVAADMVGDVTCVSQLPGTFMTRCWLGDAAGRLWKIEIGSPARSDWKMNLMYDPYNFVGSLALATNSGLRAPVYEAPAVSYTKVTGEPVVVFGSGDMDHMTDASRIAFVASVTDATVKTVPAACSPWLDNLCWRSVSGGLKNGPSLNWKFFLGYDGTMHQFADEAAGARLMGSPIVYGGNAYFTTFTPSLTDQCIPGTGRLYGVDYLQHDGACDVPVPRLPTADPYVDETWQAIGTVETGAVPYGVIAINRPACVGGESIAGAGGGSTTGSALTALGVIGTLLIIQTGMDTGEGDETPVQGSTERTIEQVSRAMAQTLESILVGTWGSVFD